MVVCREPSSNSHGLPLFDVNINLKSFCQYSHNLGLTNIVKEICEISLYCSFI